LTSTFGTESTVSLTSPTLRASSSAAERILGERPSDLYCKIPSGGGVAKRGRTSGALLQGQGCQIFLGRPPKYRLKGAHAQAGRAPSGSPAPNEGVPDVRAVTREGRQHSMASVWPLDSTKDRHPHYVQAPRTGLTRRLTTQLWYLAWVHVPDSISSVDPHFPTIGRPASGRGKPIYPACAQPWVPHETHRPSAPGEAAELVSETISTGSMYPRVGLPLPTHAQLRPCSNQPVRPSFTHRQGSTSQNPSGQHLFNCCSDDARDR
jgi:hypothetical protein